jgi:peptidyl-tRNA hydrolase
MTFTLVVDDAVCPLSSTTLHVTVIGPGAAPEVDNVAEELVPLTEPAVEL